MDRHRVGFCVPLSPVLRRQVTNTTGHDTDLSGNPFSRMILVMAFQNGHTWKNQVGDLGVDRPGSLPGACQQALVNSSDAGAQPNSWVSQEPWMKLVLQQMKEGDGSLVPSAS